MPDVEVIEAFRVVVLRSRTPGGGKESKLDGFNVQHPTLNAQLSTEAEGKWARTTCLDSETVEKKGQPAFQNMLTTSELARVLLWLTSQPRRVRGRRSAAVYSGIILGINGGPDHHDDPGRHGDPDHDDRYPQGEAIRRDRDRGLAR